MCKTFAAGTILLDLLLLALHSQVAKAFVFETPCRFHHQGERHVRPYSGQTEHNANRKPFITGNWKLNPTTRQEAIELASEIAQSVTPSSPGDVALFVPYPFIESVQKVVGDRVTVGAEAVVPYASGAYTGGISVAQLKSIGVERSLAGHSERRTIFKETDEDINAQCRALVDNGMNVVLCVGETDSEYEKNLAKSVCEIQLKKGLNGISSEQMSQVTIAYEPVWAIGTGKVATPEIAQDVHRVCRDIIRGMYGHATADKTRILYGGSVSPESVDGLMLKPDIDGALVGGASLNAASFGRIINFQAPTGEGADGSFVGSLKKNMMRTAEILAG